MLTSACDCAPAPVILLLPVLEVLVSSERSLSGLGVGLGGTPQDEGGSLPEGRLACSKATLALIAQLVEEALCHGEHVWVGVVRECGAHVGGGGEAAAGAGDEGGDWR